MKRLRVIKRLNNADNATKAWTIAVTVLLCCVVMAVTDAVIKPGYAVKSVVKILTFGLSTSVFFSLFSVNPFRDILKPTKKGILTALLIGIAVFGAVIAAFSLTKDVFDYSSVAGSLTGDAGVTRENFVYVSVYISFVNSFLEEFFFRGYAFLTLRSVTKGKCAFFFSAAAFALYHVAIMAGWFDLLPTLVIVAALFAGGLVLNLVNVRYGNIYVSWLIHMFANFAINYIGFCLLNA